MRLIPSGAGFLAVQPYQGARGRVQCAGYGETRLKAMEACTGLLDKLAHEGSAKCD